NHVPTNTTLFPYTTLFRSRDILNSHNINFEENSHTKDIILKADEVVKSPGIPDTSLIVQELKEKGTSIISEIEFASRYTSAKLRSEEHTSELQSRENLVCR